MAELLSGIVLYQLAHPGCALISGVGSAVADMRSGGYIASSPEIGLINLICLEMSRFYGLPTQATGMSADAKAANFQAGSEGGMTALTAALAGADSLISAGGLDGVQISSLREVRARQRPDRRAAPLPARGHRSTRRPRSWTTSSRSASAGTSSGARARARFSRSEVWRPQVFQRGTFEEFAGRPLAEEAAARAREILRDARGAAAAADATAHRRGHRGWSTRVSRAADARSVAGAASQRGLDGAP